MNGNGARNISMGCSHRDLNKFASPTDRRFQHVFNPHFEGMVEDAIAHGAQPQTNRPDEDAFNERLQNLGVLSLQPC